jgi:hypothetical protein
VGTVAEKSRKIFTNVYTIWFTHDQPTRIALEYRKEEALLPEVEVLDVDRLDFLESAHTVIHSREGTQIFTIQPEPVCVLEDGVLTCVPRELGPKELGKIPNRS